LFELKKVNKKKDKSNSQREESNLRPTDYEQVVAPKSEAIDAAVRITQENIRAKITTYVNINNHFEGSAPLTAERFIKALGSP